MMLIIAEKSRVGIHLLEELETNKQAIAITEKLEEFVVDAFHHDVVNVREAENILHPMPRWLFMGALCVFSFGL